MKESHKRSRNPKYKPKYKVKNWSQYEQSLRNRGNLTLWLSPKAIKAYPKHTSFILSIFSPKKLFNKMVDNNPNCAANPVTSLVYQF